MKSFDELKLDFCILIYQLKGYKFFPPAYKIGGLKA